MKPILISLLALLLGGCSGASISSDAGSQFASGILKDTNPVKAAQLRPGGGGHYHGVRVHGVGGTIEYKPVKKYDVVVPYAPNSLGKKGHTTAIIGYENGWFGDGVPGAGSGFVIDWQGLFILNSGSITFDNDQLTMTLSGNALNPKSAYTLFLYTSDPRGGNWQLISQTPLGMPTNGTLSAPSAFENGFTASTGYTLLSLEH